MRNVRFMQLPTRMPPKFQYYCNEMRTEFSSDR